MDDPAWRFLRDGRQEWPGQALDSETCSLAARALARRRSPNERVVAASERAIARISAADT